MFPVKYFIAVLFAMPFLYGFTGELKKGEEDYDKGLIDSFSELLFDDLTVNDVNVDAFYYALKGYKNLLHDGVIKNKTYLTVIDFDQPLTQKRMFIIDMFQKKVIYNSLVSHGENSGSIMAESFSNEVDSYQSSLGFYLTDNTYYGKHGLSLRIDGLEKGINDNARKRNIVIHNADYLSPEYIKENKVPGRSQGCASLPPDENYSKIIKLIRGKSLMFIYSSKGKYLEQTSVL